MDFKFIKKVLYFAFLSTVFYCNILFANNVRDIDILVDINNDGSATISQSWDGDFYEGTECYIPIKIDRKDISNFNVSLNNRTYTYDGKWNVNNSFEQKSYHCGINELGDSIELCFGISKYGQNKYIFQYKIKDFIKSYVDYDGFNYMLLNPNLSIYPSKVDCVVRMANGTKLSKDNSAIWAYGLSGEVAFDNGYIHAYSNSKISGSDHLILVMSLQKGIITPQKSVNDYFEDVIFEANKGSDYEHYYYESDYYNSYNDNQDRMFNILFYGAIVLFFVFYIVAIINNVIKWYQKKSFYKNCVYFREVPNNKDMTMTYALIKDFSHKQIKETNIFGALLLQMIYDKNLDEETVSTVGFFGNEKTNTNLVLKNRPTEEFKAKLYDILAVASNGNGILEENEFSNYAKHNFEKLNDFLSDFYSAGRNALSQNQCYKKIFTKDICYLTDIGKAQLTEAIGLKKFLEDFTMIDEREIKEVSIWDSYLVYATMFGVSDKVIKQMKKVYPQELIDQQQVNIDYLERSYIYSRMFDNMIVRNYTRYHHVNQSMFGNSGWAGSIGGFGGSISSGGGGGFSGGGMGGGTR